MTNISVAEFERLCEGIREDSESIFRHNPVGSREETLLWMLMSCLVGYLNLSEIEMPCFTGRPNVETYREAIRFMLRGRAPDEIEIDARLNELLRK